MKKLLEEISKCTICEPHLAHGVNPIMAADKDSRIVIIGQAPGLKVHQNGIPWKDKSGDNLRKWMGVNNEVFYDAKKIALLPMGFCYPGKGKTGDLPPRKECAPQWHDRVLKSMHETKLTLLIGKYAQEYYLGELVKVTLTETVRNFQLYLPEYFVLPHPSPRNNIWQAKNPWFQELVIPSLKKRIEDLL